MPVICGLLVLRIPLKQISQTIKPILTQISQKLVGKLLYISIDPLQTPLEHVSKIDLINIVPQIYKTASGINPHLDVRVLNPIDISLKYRLSEDPSLIITNQNNETSHDTSSNTMGSIGQYLKSHFHNNLEQVPIECLNNEIVDDNEQTIDENFVAENHNHKTYDHVAVGGTFDGIHVGHKILFNEATMRCKKSLIVGVTCKNMLKSKILWELIEPVEERIKKVEAYLYENDPGIDTDVVAIDDIYGPTIEQKRLQLLVVSEETQKGGQKVNEARVQKGWQALELSVVNLLKNTDEQSKDMMQRLHENKVSSSLVRLSKLGTILRHPDNNPSIPSRPYLIGLTGGVASGKTAISNFLKTIGFGCINYDLLGHKTYSSPDLPVYKKIVEYFGEGVTNPETKLIERLKLGQIVFSDKTKRELLESWVWPAIYELVDQEIDRLKARHDVIVLESALLLESKQDQRVHQVWTTFVPPEEAVRRQMVSRNLSKEEAEKRVAAQLDNFTRILRSNAVFCSLWGYEFTQYQVRKCVEELRKKYLGSTL